MIDWNKPIETVDGRKAAILCSYPGLERTGSKIIHVLNKGQSLYGYGDVFIVNEQGYRCDDRSVFSGRKEPFIRNAPVKREGWCRMFRERGKLIVDCDVVYSTKESAEAACRRHGGDPAFMAWESEL